MREDLSVGTGDLFCNANPTWNKAAKRISCYSPEDIFERIISIIGPEMKIDKNENLISCHSEKILL